MLRPWLMSLGMVGGVVAPFQCASDPPPSGVREETPGEALKNLADEFAKAGDREARVRTLRFLIERYPRSRFAEEAQAELETLGVGSASPPATGAASAADAASAAPPAVAPSPQ